MNEIPSALRASVYFWFIGSSWALGVLLLPALDDGYRVLPVGNWVLAIDLLMVFGLVGEALFRRARGVRCRMSGV